MSPPTTHFHSFGKVTQMGYMPTRLSGDAVSYDLRSAYDVLIEPYDRDTITTDIWVSLPHGCIGVVTICNDWTEYTMLDVVCRVIDIPHTPNLGIIIWNHSAYLLEICRGSRIGQLVFHKVHSV